MNTIIKINIAINCFLGLIRDAFLCPLDALIGYPVKAITGNDDNFFLHNARGRIACTVKSWYLLKHGFDFKKAVADYEAHHGA